MGSFDFCPVNNNRVRKFRHRIFISHRRVQKVGADRIHVQMTNVIGAGIKLHIRRYYHISYLLIGTFCAVVVNNL